jgi:hypothetical protein
MRNFLHSFRVVSLVSISIVMGAVSGCAPLNDPYGAPYGGGYAPPPPPPAPYYGGGYYGGPGYYGNNVPYDRRERRELERERQRLEEERIRLERERQREKYPAPPPVARPTQDRCPAGFRPSENKCSNEERRRGCRDMRLPSGLGCVSR